MVVISESKLQESNGTRLVYSGFELLKCPQGGDADLEEGSIANLASAATVAASSFNMEMSDPQELLSIIDQGVLKEYLGYQPFQVEPLHSSKVVHYSEPYGTDIDGIPTEASNQSTNMKVAITPSAHKTTTQKQIIKGKVLRLDDFIDTDAVSKTHTFSTTSIGITILIH